MNHLDSAANRSTLKPITSWLPSIAKMNRPLRFVLLILFLSLPTFVKAAQQPNAQMMKNADFEQGNMNNWAWQGNGAAGVEACCGQHETAYWGKGNNPYPEWPNVFTRDVWDGYVQPNPGGDVQLYQWVQVSQGQRYRLNSWVFTTGLTAFLRRWPNSGPLIDCASTASTANVPISCEFTANATTPTAIILEQGYGTTSAWAVSDDWTLTPIVTVPRDWLADTWATLPVSYYVDSNAYPTRTNIAAASWNNTMGKAMLQRTSDGSQGNIIKFVSISDPQDSNSAFTTKRKDARGVKTITVNKYWMDPWNSNVYRYGFEAREGIIAHEFGHALGLEHVQNECQLMHPVSSVQAWNCAAYQPTSGDVAGMRAIYP